MKGWQTTSRGFCQEFLLRKAFLQFNDQQNVA